MANRFEEVLSHATSRYPDRVYVALVEGLPPLARIALTARIARRAQRFFSLQTQMARKVVEATIRAAEKVAAGETITAEEVESGRDEAILRALDHERRKGSKAAAPVASIARLATRCVHGPEIAYGEACFMAQFDLQSAIELWVRSHEMEVNCVGKAVEIEHQEIKTDVEKLVLHADESGEGWIDPELAGPLDRRDDRGWRRRLEAVGITRTQYKLPREERWRRIHQALRQSGGCFYPPAVFGLLSPVAALLRVLKDAGSCEQ